MPKKENGAREAITGPKQGGGELIYWKNREVFLFKKRK